MNKAITKYRSELLSIVLSSCERDSQAVEYIGDPEDIVQIIILKGLNT